MVTKQFAKDLGQHQIRVNSVSPSLVLTEGVKNMFRNLPDLEKNARRITPLGRFSELRETVEPILYFLSDHSSVVTGTVHFVDGGLLSNIPD